MTFRLVPPSCSDGKRALCPASLLLTLFSLLPALAACGVEPQVQDLDGDEEDGLDETLMPMDFEEVGHIVDDEIHNILVKGLQAGSSLTSVIDTCHSGTVRCIVMSISVARSLRARDRRAATGAVCAAHRFVWRSTD